MFEQCSTLLIPTCQLRLVVQTWTVHAYPILGRLLSLSFRWRQRRCSVFFSGPVTLLPQAPAHPLIHFPPSYWCSTTSCTIRIPTWPTSRRFVSQVVHGSCGGTVHVVMLPSLCLGNVSGVWLLLCHSVVQSSTPPRAYGPSVLVQLPVKKLLQHAWKRQVN